MKRVTVTSDVVYALAHNQVDAFLENGTPFTAWLVAETLRGDNKGIEISRVDVAAEVWRYADELLADGKVTSGVRQFGHRAAVEYTPVAQVPQLSDYAAQLDKILGINSQNPIYPYVLRLK